MKAKPILYTLTVWRHDKTCGFDYHNLTLQQAINQIREVTVGSLCISNPNNRVELSPEEVI